MIRHEDFVPKDNLSFWLSARHGIEKSETGHLKKWTNPRWPEGTLYIVPLQEDHKISIGQGTNGPYVEFRYNEAGSIKDRHGP